MATLAADNRYSRVKYAQTKYGPSAAKKTLAWGVEVDWNGDGIFEANEANRMIGISGMRGRTNLLQSLGSGFEPFQTGKFTVILDDQDGRYDPYNSASPLFPNVSYGKDVRIRVRDMNTGTLYPVFYGILADIVPSMGLDGNATVSLQLEDAWSYLRNNNPRVPIQTSITTDAAMLAVLNAINWPSRWGIDLDVSTDTPQYYWALASQNGGEAMQDLANAGAGSFFISASGKATYRVRTDISAAVLDVSQSIVYKDAVVSQPWFNLRNVVKFVANPRTLANSGVIWQQSGVAPSILPGVPLVFFAPYSYGGVASPAKNVLQPSPSTDWTTNTQADGGGADKTGNCTLAITDFGDTAMVVVVNNDAGQVYLTKAQIQGQAVYSLSTVTVAYPADITTVKNPRVFSQDLPWQQDVNVAQVIVSVLGPFYGATFPVVTVRMAGRPDQQFLAELVSTVTVTLPKYGLNGNSMRVGGIQLASQDPGCQDILTTLYLEPYPILKPGGVYDTAVYDTDTYGW